MRRAKPDVMLETTTNGARAFLATLKANGIDTMFGLPGSTEAPLLEALRDDGTIRYVLTLQESVTVAMADGYARASGGVGVVGLHTSVGTMNGLNQIYNAWRDGSPVVVTAGHKDSGVQAVDGFCAVQDLPGLARGFTKHAWQSLTPNAVASDLRRAIHVAAANPPGPTYLSIPEDVQAGAVTNGAPGLHAFSTMPDARLTRRPDAGAIAAAVALLRTAKRPILVIGADADPVAVRALADAFELPVFAIERTQMSLVAYPARDDRFLGQYGEEKALLAGVDCVAVIGARAFVPFSSEAGANIPDGATFIHACADAAQIGWSIVPDVGLAGETNAVIADLRAAIESGGGIAPDVRALRIGALRDQRAIYDAANAKDRAYQDALAAEAGAVSLVALTDAIGETLPENALVFDEAISSSRPLLRHTAWPAGCRVHRTNGGALGWGVPAAVGAKIAAPDRAVLAVVGDGTFHFTPQALWTATRENAPVVTVIVDNGGYLAVKLAIERHLHLAKDTREHPGTSLPQIDHVSVARGYGADAHIVDDPAKLSSALRAAFASPRSTVIVVPVPNARR